MHSSRCLLAVVPLFAAVLLAQSKSQEKTHADHMEHRFDQPEQFAKMFDDPARDAWQMPDRVIAALGLKRGDIVADVGSGTGYFTVRLAKSEAAPKVYGADIEPSMVTYLRERAAKEGLKNVVSVQAAADTPNLPEPVDVVLIVDTYHHIGGREAYFQKLAKSLKPGGRVAIIDFKPDSPDGPPKEFRFSPGKFKSEMAKAGYKLVAQHDFLPRQQFLIFGVAGASSR
ncbi:MAG: methyltransferase domain-containing protein [Acidobacteriia bacterium]|nr:methyltransferase domain-containing protein [Terriglobia bacterium]